jgi:hypothetical protein
VVKLELVLRIFSLLFLFSKHNNKKMPGSILQLQSVGVQDAFLTENPQINIFKYSYYRYANFAIEIEKLTPKEKVEYGKRMTCDIPKRGHLLSKLFLYVSLPELVKTSGTYACWTDALGHAMFRCRC